MSLATLFASAHPNSALRRKHPTGCHASDLPHWLADTTDADQRTNTGFPDDFDPNRAGDGHASRWSASAYQLSTAHDSLRIVAHDRDDAAAVLWDLGANLPAGHPFAPCINERAAA